MIKIWHKKAAIAAATGILLSTSVLAQDANTDENVFVFGGPLTKGYFGDAFLVWEDNYESNFFAGVGYQRFLYEYLDFQMGVEVGLGVRVGSPSSGEAWAGIVNRLMKFEIGEVNIVPSITGGFSVVTDTIGVETERTAASGDSAAFLYYLAPEVSVSLDSQPEWEAFGRIQHRSGGFGTIAHIDGSNAVTVGLRYKF
ncbi:MAG: hypothetical protein KIT02_10645 [Devosia sp.]|uniref:hypothetical protein n=1 Tax=Devosia sp. TaxID=1871048 RepID=UPI0024C97000|nr:hypothetical protein [Devosia sp.]UYN98416.1 MAG: hypothetical protein KIT02_10645 [Devosia sp.]